MGTKDKILSETKTKLQGVQGRLELNKNLRHWGKSQSPREWKWY